jgi:hypothetical protein
MGEPAGLADPHRRHWIVPLWQGARVVRSRRLYRVRAGVSFAYAIRASA